MHKEMTPRYQRRRDWLFMSIAGIFLASLTMMNLLGISRFIDLSFSFFGHQVPMLIPIGVLPYPITFLCTDLISELFGSKQANRLVFAGLVANMWMLFFLWFVGYLPPLPELVPTTHLPSVTHPEYAFYQIRMYAMGGMLSSMVAYIVAQYLDVYLYHFWKRVTKGKHLWLRNNGSTMISQFVDTVIVVICSYLFLESFPITGDDPFRQLLAIIGASYVFKLLAALVDTLPFYFLVNVLSRYLGEASKDKSEQLSLFQV